MNEKPNKNPEAAAPEKAERNGARSDGFFKIAAMLILSVIMLIFSSFAWFAMNKEIGTGGMGIKPQGVPYVIRTRDSSGYYSSVFESLSTEGAEWQVSSDHNLENHTSAIEEGEDEPGLEPGDSGVLEFRVDPNASETITVDCLFDVSAYLESIVRDEHGNPVLDDHGDSETEITQIDNEILLGFIRSHIMLFTDYDPVTGKYSGLIDNESNESVSRILEDRTYSRGGTDYTQIYWVWPEHLDDLTNSDDSKILYDSEERQDVIDYIARNRNGFFKDCNEDRMKVYNDLMALSVSYSNTIYNHYNMRYDNADLEIGNNMSYIILSMNVKE